MIADYAKMIKMRGFEKKPDGQLLKQLLELQGPMGLAYERSVGFNKDFHCHDRLMIVCPRGGSRMKVSHQGTKESYVVDSSCILTVPPLIQHDDLGLTTVYDTLALFPSDVYVDQAISESRLSPHEKRKLLTVCHRVRRSQWLDELISRYFFKRVIKLNSTGEEIIFLEKQIINELLQLIFESKFKKFTKDLFSNSESDSESRALTALKYIESNLFENLNNEKIAAHVKISVPTLLRIFKKEYKQSPYSFIKKRRLDEAHALLKSGDYSVSDVAILVGYEDFSAFSRAFKVTFDCAPSQVVARSRK